MFDSNGVKEDDDGDSSMSGTLGRRAPKGFAERRKLTPGPFCRRLWSSLPLSWSHIVVLLASRISCELSREGQQELGAVG